MVGAIAGGSFHRAHPKQTPDTTTAASHPPWLQIPFPPINMHSIPNLNAQASAWPRSPAARRPPPASGAVVRLRRRRRCCRSCLASRSVLRLNEYKVVISTWILLHPDLKHSSGRQRTLAQRHKRDDDLSKPTRGRQIDLQSTRATPWLGVRRD